MMLNGGTLDGRRYLSPTTIKLMTSDHLGNRPGSPLTPGALLMGVDGYTFGLGFMGRQGPGPNWSHARAIIERGLKTSGPSGATGTRASANTSGPDFT